MRRWRHERQRSTSCNIGECSNQGDVAGCELTPVRENGGKNGLHFSRAELQQPVSLASSEGAEKAFGNIRRDGCAVAAVVEKKLAVRRQNGCKHDPAILTEAAQTIAETATA